MLTLRARFAIGVVALALGSSAALVACDLNPQPLPPGAAAFAPSGGGNDIADSSTPTVGPGAKDSGTFGGGDSQVPPASPDGEAPDGAVDGATNGGDDGGGDADAGENDASDDAADAGEEAG
jgi:hypothetical protein